VQRVERGVRGVDLAAVLADREPWDTPAWPEPFARADGMSATANASERSADLMLWPVYHP